MSNITRITSITIEDEYYASTKPAKYKCKVSATLLGGEIEINNFTFDESIAQQFADSMIYQLEKRLRTAIEAQPEKEVAHVTQ